MPSNWKNRLAIKIQTDDGQFLLSPIKNMTPTFNTPHTSEHSIEGDNKGVTKGNAEFAFTLTVDAVQDPVSGTNPYKLLMNAQLKGTAFNIVIVEQQRKTSDANQFPFDTSLILEECYVNTNSLPIISNGRPTGTFGGIAMRVNADGDLFDGNEFQ